MSDSDKVVPFNDSARNSGDAPQREPDHTALKWEFLCFLGNIDCGDPSLGHLFAMARGSSTDYNYLGPNKKDMLVFGGYLDNQNCLLKPFRDIARRCIFQQSGSYVLNFDAYKPLIAFMQGEGAQSAERSSVPQPSS